MFVVPSVSPRSVSGRGAPGPDAYVSFESSVLCASDHGQDVQPNSGSDQVEDVDFRRLSA